MVKGLSALQSENWFPGRFWEARNITEFWSKWNPGVHNGYILLYKWVRRKFNTPLIGLPYVLFIFLFTGFWHDAIIWAVGVGQSGFFEYTFIIFFAINAISVIFDRVFIPKFSFIPTCIKKGLTSSYVFLSLIASFALNDIVINYLY